MTVFTLYTILYIITTLGIFTVAALVYLRQRTQLNKTFALFTFFLGLWVLLQFVAQVLHQAFPMAADVAFRIALGLPAFFAVEFRRFTQQYVGKPPSDRGLRIVEYAIPIAAAVSAFIPGLLYTNVTLNDTGIAVDATPIYFALVAFVVVYVFWGIKNLVSFLRHTTNGAAHYSARLLLAGVGLALIIVVTPIVLFPDLLLSQLWIPFGILVMVSLFAYAIVRHRLFDIRLIAVRLLAYLLSLLVVATLFSLLVFGLFAQLLEADGLTLGQELSLVAIAMLLAVTFAPLKRFFDRATRAVFYQDAYDTQQVLDDIGTVLVRKMDVRRLVRDSLTTLRVALKSEFIVIVLLDEHGGVDRTISVGKSLQLTEAFSAIVRRAAPLIITDDLEAQDKRTYGILQRANIAVVANLETSKELIGYIAYGSKASGRVYSTDDLKLIRIATDGLAVAVQNALRFEEISRFNETLQEEIREATGELRESNKKLKSLDEAKDEFISMASHQLRTPLTSVKGYLSMVLEGDAGKLSPTQHQLLEQAFASSQRMVYLISDFLNVSRLQTGKFTIERTPVILSNVVMQEVSQLRSTADSRNISLECSVPSNFPVLQLDESKLRQAIMNFLDNAIFYSHPGGTIKVDLVKTAKELTLTVQDQGIGVPAGERHRLFNKFYRATNARTARPDGTGIGLFMAKKIVIAHGGSIIFNSVEGKGSTFGFRLPLKQPPVAVLLEDHPKELKN